MEEPTTLSDALLDDLDDLSDVEEKESSNDREYSNEEKPSSEASVCINGEKSKSNRYLDSYSLKSHLVAIERFRLNIEASNGFTKEEQEQEYDLIVQSNRHLANLSNELSKAHLDLCDAYQAKFPELEELLPNALQYKNAVKVIMNETDMNRVNDGLNNFLSSNQIITISISFSTTSGRQLNEVELQRVEESVSYMDEISVVQQQLASFVESRMEALAPNVCALIGPSTAAQILGLAGGLAELSKIPACNLQVMGQSKQNATSRAGFSISSTNAHQGLLAQCELVQECPKHLRNKALKVVAAKLALAARCDFVNVDTGRPRTAISGEQFREEIKKKFHKWEEPDEAPKLKALPKPDLTIKKRRGGKRMRRIKERFEETSMMKQANTRAFASQAGEYGDDSMGLTMGLLDTAEVSAGGNLRKTTEKRKIRFANTKASRKKQAQMSAASSNRSGLASSVVFTPVQGMELVNPDAIKDRVKAANEKWFSDNAGFRSALPK